MESSDSIHSTSLNEENFGILLEIKLKEALEEKISSIETKYLSDLSIIEILKYEFYENVKKYESYTSHESENDGQHEENSDYDKNQVREENKSPETKLNGTVATSAVNKNGGAGKKTEDKKKTKERIERSSTPIKVNKKPLANVKHAETKTSVNRSVIVEGTPKLDKIEKKAATTGHQKKASILIVKKKYEVGEKLALKTEGNVTSPISKVQAPVLNRRASASPQKTQKRSSLIEPKSSPRKSMMESNVRKSSVLKNEAPVRKSSLVVAKKDGKESVKKEGSEKSLENTDDISNQINLIKINEEKQKQILKIEGRLLPSDFALADKSTKALFLTVNSKFADKKIKYLLYTSVLKIKNNFDARTLVNDKLNQLEGQIIQMEEQYSRYLNDPFTSSLINKKFSPSKTAQNGLTFVTKTEEENLWKKEQPEEITNVFKLIYIILNEKMDDLAPNKLIENLINNLLPKIQMENLKNLFVTYFSTITDFYDSQYDALQNIINENPKILSSPDYLKLNRCVSYMIFIIKEAWEFISLKTPDGVMIFNLRKVQNEITQLKEKVQELKNRMH